MGSEPGASAPRELTGEEAALYDRQIRLWGLEAQRKLASAHVLLAGTSCSLLGHELAKNIVLSGVARLGLCAAGKAPSPGFLGSDINATALSLRDMNPHVDVSVVDEVLPHIQEFSIVCIIGMTRKEELIIASACREKGVAFTAGRTAGPVGWIFFDLGDVYKFQVKKSKDRKDSLPKADETAEMTDKEIAFCTYKDAIAAPWGGEFRRAEFGWHIASTLLEFEDQKGRLPTGDDDDQQTLLGIYEKFNSEKKPANSKKELIEQVGIAAQFTLPPVAAILGGMWGREVIKYVSGKDEPINNLFFFNSKTGIGSLQQVGPVE